MEVVTVDPNIVEKTVSFTFNNVAFKVDIFAVETTTIIPVIEEKIIVEAFNEDVIVITSINVELIITFALNEETLIVDAVRPVVIILDVFSWFVIV